MKAKDIKREGGKLVYRGEEFSGFNKPKKDTSGAKTKKVVLAKKGDEVKLVRYGHKDYQDFTQHKDPQRRENYLKRSAGIKDKSGKLTKDDPFSANYWARKDLW